MAIKTKVWFSFLLLLTCLPFQVAFILCHRHISYRSQVQPHPKVWMVRWQSWGEWSVSTLPADLPLFKRTGVPSPPAGEGRPALLTPRLTRYGFGGGKRASLKHSGNAKDGVPVALSHDLPIPLPSSCLNLQMWPLYLVILYFRQKC